jgi:hypothetical protein
MTTVFDDESDQPRMHALVIGVGRYRYSLRGVEHGQAHVESGRPEDQLKSAPRAAEAFATWLLTHQKDSRAAPLGSLEAAISSDGQMPRRLEDRDLEAPTWQETSTAFDTWLERCNRNPGNVAVFYFSGHGCGLNSDQYLLLEDVGESVSRFFANAVDFSGTLRGMFRCKAKIQCFFIDACATVLDGTDGGALPLISANGSDVVERDCLALTSPYGAKAYESSEGTTRFTDALLQALGFGANNVNGTWQVTTGTLDFAVQEMLRWNRKPGEPEQTVARGSDSPRGGFIHTLASPPAIPFRFDLDPAEALRFADLSLRAIRSGGTSLARSAPSAQGYRRQGNGSGPWEAAAPVGEYDFEALFKENAYGNLSQDEHLYPPSPRERTFTVRPT